MHACMSYFIINQWDLSVPLAYRSKQCLQEGHINHMTNRIYAAYECVCVYANIYKHTHTMRESVYLCICVLLLNRCTLCTYIYLYTYIIHLYIFMVYWFSHTRRCTHPLRRFIIYASAHYAFMRCCCSRFAAIVYRFNIIILHRCIIHLLYSQYIPYIVRYIYDEKERCINMRLFRLYL